MRQIDMRHEKYYVGLDIGTTKIVVMIGVKNQYGKIQILGYGQAKSEGINKAGITNILKAKKSISEAVGQAERRTGLQIKDVVVGIAGQHIIGRLETDYIIRTDSDKLIDSEDVTRLEKQVYNIGLQPGQQIIHVLPQEYKIDGVEGILDPIGMIGSRLDASFHLVIGQLSTIRNISRCVEEMRNLKLNRLILEPLASASAVLSKEEKEAGVALVDIGGGTTDVAIFKDGIIRQTAVIPEGGNIITKDIKDGCCVLEGQAEQLKLQYGSAWPGEIDPKIFISIPGIDGRECTHISQKKLAGIIHARVKDIAQAIHNIIKTYGHEDRKKSLNAGIVLTGGGSQLPHIVQLMQFVTGMDVRIGYPHKHLDSNSEKDVISPIYSTSIGLVMNAIDFEAKESERQKIEELKAVIEEEEIQSASKSDNVALSDNTENESSTEEKQPKKQNKWLEIGNRFWNKAMNLLDSSE